MKATFEHELVKRMIEEAVKAESKKAYLEGLDSGIKAEREACAKIADEWAVGWPHPSQVIAERIRERT
jgi:hypothetical protein